MIGADIERDDAFFLADGGSGSGFGRVGPAAAEHVVGQVVAERQRRHLDVVNLDVHAGEVIEHPADHVALHREQADLGIDREAPLDRPFADFLVIPDDLFQREGDLLLGLELDDILDLLLFDGRQLDEPRQARLPGYGDRDPIALDRIARQELLERLARQELGVGVGLGENLRMLDIVEGGGGRLAVDHLQAHRLQGALADVDAPIPGLNCHGRDSPRNFAAQGRSSRKTCCRRRPITGWSAPNNDTQHRLLRGVGAESFRAPSLEPWWMSVCSFDCIQAIYRRSTQVARANSLKNPRFRASQPPVAIVPLSNRDCAFFDDSDGSTLETVRRFPYDRWGLFPFLENAP
jgi:hypothetical protein